MVKMTHVITLNKNLSIWKGVGIDIEEMQNLNSLQLLDETLGKKFRKKVRKLYKYLVYKVYYYEYKDFTINGSKGSDWCNKPCLVNQEHMLNKEKK